MKRAKILLLVTCVLFAFPSEAQLTKEQIKERKETLKKTRLELKEKVSKEARKEAKKLSKQGWLVVPGALPLEKQLDKSYMMQLEYDADLFPKYIMGEAMSIGTNYDAAKMQALELAKQNLAAKIQTEVTALIENTVANKQLGSEDAASVIQSISAGKSLISQSIGRIITIVELYRTLNNNNKEVLVKIAYNSSMAKASAKKIIEEDLEKRGEKLQNNLDVLLGL